MDSRPPPRSDRDDRGDRGGGIPPPPQGQGRRYDESDRDSDIDRSLRDSKLCYLAPHRLVTHEHASHWRSVWFASSHRCVLFSLGFWPSALLWSGALRYFTSQWSESESAPDLGTTTTLPETIAAAALLVLVATDKTGRTGTGSLLCLRVATSRRLRASEAADLTVGLTTEARPAAALAAAAGRLCPLLHRGWTFGRQSSAVRPRTTITAAAAAAAASSGC